MTTNEDDTEIWSTLKVAKIPSKTTNSELESAFSRFGPLKRCFVVASKDYGYVEFVSPDDAKTVMDSKEKIVLKEADLKVTYSKGVNPDRKKQEEQKEFDRKVAKEKRARLIVRNLSFKSTDETLRAHFSKYGTVTDINILKKPDGKMVGCGFVQFANVAEASKAIKMTNAKPFLQRPIAVDWAVSKEKYGQQSVHQQEKPKDVDESEQDDEQEMDIDNEEESEEECDGNDDDQEDDDDDNDNDDENEDDDDDEDEEDEKPRNNVPKLETGHDVDEGKTIFIRNLSFDSTEKDLKTLLEDKYGPVIFAKFVIDKLTNHPRGSGFVKFTYPESAQKAINDTDALTLDERRLIISLALTKTKADNLQVEKKKKEMKDSRNLHLAREGLVREGTKAAEGVSKSDLALRLRVEKWKRSILKDLNMFVSPVRLCIRNLPKQVDDSKLKTIFKKFGKITECKVIRDLKNSNLSKEYGFVAFDSHDNALSALRALNNNPEIFTHDRRPVIEFSIESRKALNARKRRLEKSREKNPNFRQNKKNSPDKLEFRRKEEKDEIHDKPEFMGSINNPKQRNLPSHIGPRIRGDKKPKISRRDLKRGEKERKKGKRPLEQTVEAPSKKSSKKSKKNKEKEEDFKEEKQFNDLVQRYKSKLLNADTVVSNRKQKWFSE